MPELPEVETIRRELRPHVEGRCFSRVEVFLERLVKHPTAAELVERLQGKQILALGRQGKYLVFQISGEYRLVIHLGMTGRLVYAAGKESNSTGRHTRMQLFLSDGSTLRFDDARTFGRVYLLSLGSEAAPGLSCLGPEPWEQSFTPDEFFRLLQRRKASIKNVLLQQNVVAGLGNIYADEALFAAGIHPARPAHTLKDDEVCRLHAALRRVLEQALESGGTTFRDYVRGNGQPGNYQHQLRVYGRRGKECRCCGTELEGMRLAGRSSVFCPCCQPASTGTEAAAVLDQGS